MPTPRRPQSHSSPNPAVIHPSSEVSSKARIGKDTRVWLWCQIREGARIGSECVLGKGVYVDADVEIGNRVKVQNGASIFSGVRIEDGVFIGPHVCFTNDLYPRAINPDGSAKSAQDWTVTPTVVREGAALGANSTIVCGVTIGRWSLIGAGSVVSKDVPDHGFVVGNPARLIGYACKCGRKMIDAKKGSYVCQKCSWTYRP